MEKSTTRRFILRNTQLPELAIGQNYTLDRNEEEIVFQLTKVFRTKPGQSLILINLNSNNPENREFLFKVNSATSQQVELTLESIRTFQETFSQSLVLALCLPNKPAKLEFILEKATEIGVTAFKLIASDFSNYSHQLRPDRLEKIILEAAEQSERARLPQLLTFKSLDQYFNETESPIYACLERGEDRQSILDQGFNSDLELLIGPEGGFSEREIPLLLQKSTPINIGGHILKMDTAALLATAIVALKLERK